MMLLSMFTVLMVPPGSAKGDPPINIDGNEDLEQTARSYHWPGSGTSDDPYVISGWNIGGGIENNAIYLRYVTSYVIVENCHITGFNTGISLMQCSNMVLRNNTIEGDDDSNGIGLDECTDCAVINNTIVQGDFGIKAEDSMDNLIFGNHVSKMSTGISLSTGGQENLVANNTVLDSTRNSIEVEAPDNVFANNTITGNCTGIIIDEDATDVRLENNTITDTGHGTYGFGGIISYEAGTIIVDNELHGCSVVVSPGEEEGIQETIDSYVIEGNTVNGDPVMVYRNQDLLGATVSETAGENIFMNVTNAKVYDTTVSGGVEILASSYIDIEGISVSDSAIGVVVLFSHNCTIVGNHLTGIGIYAVGVTNSRDIAVAYNTISGALNAESSVGTYVMFSTNVTIEHNVLSDLYRGMNQFYGASDCALGNNTITGCQFGIYLYRSSGDVVENNAVDGCDVGICLYRNNDAVVTSNKVVGSEDMGICADGSLDSTIRGNNVTGSQGYGIYAESGDGNLFYENLLIQNNGADDERNGDHVQAYDGGEGAWSLEGVGNYWADWQLPDDNEDGVVDLPYVLDDNDVQDDYPMVINFVPLEPMPSVEITAPSNNSYLNTGDVTVTWEAGDESSEIANYSIDIDGEGWINASLETTWAFEDLEEGAHLVTVKAFDVDGKEASSSVNFTISFGPVITTDPSTPYYTNKSSVLVTVFVRDNVPMTDGNFTFYRNGELIGDMGIDIPEQNGTYYENNIPLGLDEGTNLLYLTANDSAGNSVTIVLVMVRDSTAPTVNITAPGTGSWHNTTSVEVAWTASDNIELQPYYWLALDGGAWMNTTDDSYVLEGLSEGPHSVVVRAFDGIGNYTDDSQTFNVQTTLPELDITAPVDGSYSTSDALTASWTGESVSGIGAYWVSVDGSAWTKVDLNITYDLSDLAEGVHTFALKAEDLAGSWNTVSATFTVDTVAPTIVDKGPMGDDLALSSTVTVSFSEAMDHAATTVSISGVSGTVAWNGNTATFTPSAALAYGITYAVTVSGKDIAGNAVEASWTFKTLDNKGTISGIALDENGEPLANATVTLSNGMTATTDEDGHFVIADVPSGTYTVTITKGDYKRVIENVSASAGATTALGTVTVEETAKPADNSTFVMVGLAVAVVLAACFLLFWKRKNG